jgi:hypothetical protein
MEHCVTNGKVFSFFGHIQIHILAPNPSPFIGTLTFYVDTLSGEGEGLQGWGDRVQGVRHSFTWQMQKAKNCT